MEKLALETFHLTPLLILFLQYHIYASPQNLKQRVYVALPPRDHVGLIFSVFNGDPQCFR